jgi:GntR family transcriptional regulator
MRELQSGSLAAQAREAILTAILSNEFDGRLPSEDMLGEMLNVSRTTVRAAVQDLERDGLITRRRAVGTTINDHVGPETLALQRLVGFDWLLREKGHEVEVDIRDFVPWSALKAETLPASPEPSLFEFSRLYCRVPIAHAVAQIVPMVSERGTTRLDLPAGTPFIRLHELHYGPRAEPAAWSRIDFDDSVLRLEVFRGQ